MGMETVIARYRATNPGFWSKYPELMYPRSQGTRVEAEDRCGPAFPLDAPSGFHKDFMDMISFQLF